MLYQRTIRVSIWRLRKECIVAACSLRRAGRGNTCHGGSGNWPTKQPSRKARNRSLRYCRLLRRNWQLPQPLSGAIHLAQCDANKPIAHRRVHCDDARTVSSYSSCRGDRGVHLGDGPLLRRPRRASRNAEPAGAPRHGNSTKASSVAMRWVGIPPAVVALLCEQIVILYPTPVY